MKATDVTHTDNGYDLNFVSTGICSGCEVCRQDHGLSAAQLEVAVDSGAIADEPSFSWHPCELCGATEGGDRYPAHGRDENDDIIHIEVCVDCLMAINNQTLKR